MAFFRTPGIERLYSGVTISRPSRRIDLLLERPSHLGVVVLGLEVRTEEGQLPDLDVDEPETGIRREPDEGVGELAVERWLGHAPDDERDGEDAVRHGFSCRYGTSQHIVRPVEAANPLAVSSDIRKPCIRRTGDAAARLRPYRGGMSDSDSARPSCARRPPPRSCAPTSGSPRALMLGAVLSAALGSVAGIYGDDVAGHGMGAPLRRRAHRSARGAAALPRGRRRSSARWRSSWR